MTVVWLTGVDMPELLPCGYLVGDSTNIAISLKGLTVMVPHICQHRYRYMDALFVLLWASLAQARPLGHWSSLCNFAIIGNWQIRQTSVAFWSAAKSDVIRNWRGRCTFWMYIFTPYFAYFLSPVIIIFCYFFTFKGGGAAGATTCNVP